jgi:F-type H+-transporting ATPase subunit a
LFWNILAGMVLLWLMIVAAAALWDKLGLWEIPFLLPLVVFVVELFVGFLQALVFSLLVLVYFKLAEQSHH